MTYGYIRVSTEQQNLENQKLTIRRRFKINKWVEEKRSGTIDFHKRSLGELIEELQEGDTLVVTELSRLGRSLTMIYEIISELRKKNIRVIAIKNSFDMKPEDSNDISSQVLMFAFGLSAQIERDLISERTKQGLAVARANGKIIGRQDGEMPYNVKLRPYQKEIIEKRKAGRSINSLAWEYGVDWRTMKTFLTYYIYVKKPKYGNIVYYRKLNI